MVRGRPPRRGRGRGRAPAETTRGFGERAPTGRGGEEHVGSQLLDDARIQLLEAEVAGMRGQLTALSGMLRQFFRQQTAATTPPAPPQVQTAPVTVDPSVVPAQTTAPAVATTFEDYREQAMMAGESDEVRSEWDALERSGDRKRSHARSSGGPSSSRRPPKLLRIQQSTKSAHLGDQRRKNRCVICGKAHRVNACPRRHDHCYRCGQLGHFRAQCPLRDGARQGAASSPAVSLQNRGALSAAVSPGRPSSSRQNEGTRQASDGRVFTLPQHGDDTVPEVLAGIITLSITRTRITFDTGASLPFLPHSYACESVLSRPDFNGRLIKSMFRRL